MRLLHTADWHLGRAFHGAGLLGAQARWLDWLVELAGAERPDAILVAGDLYDRALPPVDAVRLADEALARLTGVAPVVVISGNHDSPARLRFGARLLARGGLHLRTDPLEVGDPVPVAGGFVYAIPFLEPDVVRGPLAATGRGHAGVLTAAMDRVRADRAGRPSDAPICVVAHACVLGADPCASERELAVGGAASVPTRTFAGADHLALGHLHGPQRVGTLGRYAGSPIPFSFSEAGQEKSVAITEVLSGVPARSELVPCPVQRPLVALHGTLDVLLADPTLGHVEAAWVQATLTDPVRPADAMERLRRRFPHTVVLQFDPQGAVPVADGSYGARLAGLGDGELAARFVADARGSEPSPEELELLDRALAAHRIAEAAA